jgi:hypothetical protein
VTALSAPWWGFWHAPRTSDGGPLARCGGACGVTILHGGGREGAERGIGNEVPWHVMATTVSLVAVDFSCESSSLVSGGDHNPILVSGVASSSRQ